MWYAVSLATVRSSGRESRASSPRFAPSTTASFRFFLAVNPRASRGASSLQIKPDANAAPPVPLPLPLPLLHDVNPTENTTIYTNMAVTKVDPVVHESMTRLLKEATELRERSEVLERELKNRCQKRTSIVDYGDSDEELEGNAVRSTLVAASG